MICPKCKDEKDYSDFFNDNGVSTLVCYDCLSEDDHEEPTKKNLKLKDNASPRYDKPNKKKKKQEYFLENK